MSFRKLRTLLFIAGSILAIVSCKKDKDDETAPSLNGSLSFSIDAFISPQEVVKMTPTGLEHPDCGKIGYYWKVTPGMSSVDTTRYENGLDKNGNASDGSFTYSFSDSLTTYTISCTAFADGYGNSYKTIYTTMIKPGLEGSVTGTGIKAEDDKIQVDGVDYYYATYRGLDWMRNNLANPACGTPYMNSEILNTIFGRFYSYEEALNACPEGWRLPYDREWTELAAEINGKEAAEEFTTIPDIASSFMAAAAFNLHEMWDYWPQVGAITNNSHISALPVGYVNLGEQEDGRYPQASFTGINEYAAFWTADKVTGEEGMAYYRYLVCDQPEMFVSKGDVKTFGASVRCVRESL